MDIRDISDKSNIYFVGIGGISMSSLAEILHKKGYKVSGYDCTPSPITEHLRELGIPVYYETVPEHFDGVTAAIVTAAVHDDNPEIVELKKRNVPRYSRAELLGALGSKYANSIAVAGTHGKSTTTGMLSDIFTTAKNADPTILVGAIVPELGSTFRLGTDENFIYEACEYTDSFLSFYPHIAAVLNLELDHTDYFPNIEALENSFKRFINNAGKDGIAVVNYDSAHTMIAAKDCLPKIITYSPAGNQKADYYVTDLCFDHGFAKFAVMHNGTVLVEVTLSVPGEHNVADALCAIVCADLSGIEAEDIAKGLKMFRGVSRRFELKGELNGAPVFDDYAHHPDEIKATLSAAKMMGYDRVITVFQPHTYSRLHDLFEDFACSFDNSDITVFAEIFSASREKDIYGISSKTLADRIEGSVYLPTFAEIEDFLKNEVRKGDMVIVMGAGDVTKISKDLIKT